MARRRSMNRRASRKSMNITELDQNSELIDSHDPLWWKNIEGDITVRRSRRSSYANTTDPILNDDSVADPAGLQDDWWRKLDKSETETLQGISTRGSSIKLLETPHESFVSDDTDDISIKKRKVQLRARHKKSIGTENFLAALAESNLENNPESEIHESRNNTDKKPSSRNRNRRSGKSLGENPTEESLNTSTDTDSIVKSRPKPFKKRFAKIPDGIFDDVIKTFSQPQPNNTKDGSGLASDQNANDSTREQAVDTRTNKTLREKPGSKLDENEDVGLMEPPEMTSHRKRLSSISRKLVLTSDDSESESALKKQRLGFSRKKPRGTVSINPFDELVRENMALLRKDRSNLDSTLEKSKNLNPIEADREFLDNERSRSSQNISRLRKSVAAANLTSEYLSSARMEESSEKEDENRADVSLNSSLTPKVLEVSLTRISPIKRTEMSIQEANSDYRNEDNRRTRFLRSSGRLIEDSAYELPDKERSPTPRISGSENEGDKSLGQNSLRANRAANKIGGNASDRNHAARRKSRKSYARIDDSRTKIFSDEDISVEDFEHVEKSIENSKRLEDEKIEDSRKSVAGIHESRRKIESHDVTSEDVRKLQERRKNIDASRSIKNSRRSRRSVFPIDDNPENLSSVETQDAEKRAWTSGIIETRLEPRRSGLSVLSNKSRFESDVSYSEDESRISEKMDSPNLRSNENSRRSLRSDASGNKSRSGDENELIREDEIFTEPGVSRSNVKSPSRKSFPTNESRARVEPDGKDDSEMNRSKSTDSRRKIKSLASRRSVASREKSQRNVQSPGGTNAIEDAENITQDSRPGENSRRSKKNDDTRNSQRNIIHEEDFPAEEPEEPRGSEPEAESSNLQEKSRRSRKSVASKNAQQNIIRGEDFPAEEPEEPRVSEPQAESSNLQEKSRRSRKSVAPKNSQQNLIYDGNSSAEENEEARIPRAEAGTPISREKFNSSRKSIAPKNSQQNIIRAEHSDDEEHEEKEIPEPESRPSNLQNESTRSQRSFPAINSKIIRHEDTASKDEMDPAETMDSNPRSNEKSSRKSLRMSEKINSNLNVDENESENEESKTSPTKFRVSRKRSVSGTSRKRDETLEDAHENEAEDPKNESPSTRRSARSNAASQNFEPEKNSGNGREPSPGKKRTNDSGALKNKNSTALNDSSFSTRLKDASAGISSNFGPFPLDSLRKKNSTPLTGPRNDSRKQKNITDFFQSNFLQKSNSSIPREITTSFDKNKFDAVKKKIEEMKRRDIEAMNHEAETKRREANLAKRPPETLRKKKLPADNATPKKNPKIVDKAYIVNGTVYKRPKLPRPKPWVTDRLYRHLWKRMEPKYQMSTRVKSEKFVQRLSEIVALTIRRKKYDSYKLEVDALMEEMARSGIIETRNDFYDFCYDFLPYDFRVKVTPILLPGNVYSIPYDPKKLHTPILQKD